MEPEERVKQTTLADFPEFKPLVNYLMGISNLVPDESDSVQLPEDEEDVRR